MSRPDVPVDDGKYIFQQPEGDYKIHVLRHGEPWLIIESGSNAIASLLEEHREALEKLKPVKGMVPEIHQCPKCLRVDHYTPTPGQKGFVCECSEWFERFPNGSL